MQTTTETLPSSKEPAITQVHTNEAEIDSRSEEVTESKTPETLSMNGEAKDSKEVQKKRPKLIANILHTQYDVVKEVLKKKFRCKLSVEEEGEWDVKWMDTGVTGEIVGKLKPYQKINHYHGMKCITRKNHLCRNLMRIHKILPKDYNYFPATWLLPTDWNELKQEFAKKRRTYILKPEALCQGKGIFLINSLEGILPDQKYVVQRYITKPYLIDGLKFDLRIYVLVYGCDPLRIYIFREGLARLATEAYVPPTTSNMSDLYVHLTNYAINKNNENFVFNTDASKADVGHKRSLAFVWKYIDEHGGDAEKTKNRIKSCIVKTLCAVQPLLKHSYRSFQAGDNSNNMCFEILGFDILLDYKLKPWLLEVNHSPSFSTDTPFDHETKKELITDTLNIVKLDATKRERYYAKLEEKKGRITKAARADKKETEEIRRRKMEKRDKYEMEHLGGFTRIYPDERYDRFITAAIDVWNMFTGITKAKEISKKAEVTKNPKQTAVPKPKAKTKNFGNIRRKPLYYIKSQKVSPKKLSEDIFKGNEALKEALNNPSIKQVVLDKLAGIYSHEVASEEAEWIVVALKEMHDDPLPLLQEYFQLTAIEQRTVRPLKKWQPSGSFVVPKTIELAPFPVNFLVQNKVPAEDLHKPWKWRKS
eukprot:TRINITY_DN6157_c0_g1_i3.p1 TRINITY_DN6157_c0_g1~~TRINITY_DN6157_c0_g1_i3.p1  ORF type:complete len:661 (+),score=157.83 TRINITY_DN6157_c0_g1_i3:40-1983(+)